MAIQYSKFERLWPSPPAWSKAFPSRARASAHAPDLCGKQPMSYRAGAATGDATGASASWNSNASDSTSRAVGVWASNAMHGYMDVTVGGDMERAMLAMAEADVRVRPAASGRGID